MRKLALAALMAGTLVTLSACDKETKAEETLDKGQVVARVDGQDITIYELNAELQGIAIPDGVERRKVEQAALQRLIERRLLANIARERGLDKTPDYLIQSRRAGDDVLVSLLRRDAAGKVPPVTDEDAEKYVASHPQTFAERKIWVVDQIQFPIPADPSRLQEMKPLKTLDQIEQKLIADGVTYRRVPASIDTLQLPPEAVRSIAALPANEVFVTPMGSAMSANLITETRTVPVIGHDALQLARMMIQRDRLVQKAKSEFEPLVSKAREKVTYQPGFAPGTDKAPAKAPVRS